jgi:hypothetical protein
MDSDTVHPSASMFHGFTSLLAVAYLTTNSALLCNDLQHLGLLRLPHLHQGWLSHNSLRLGLVCVATDSLWTSQDSRLGLIGLCFNSPYIAPAWTQQKTLVLSWCGWDGITCSIVAALYAWLQTMLATPLPATLLLCDITTVTRTIYLSSRSLGTAFSLAALFHLSGVMLQYVGKILCWFYCFLCCEYVHCI